MSRRSIGSYEAALMVVRDLYGPDVAQFLEQELLEYSPNPLFGVGSPLLAGKWLNAISKMLFWPSLPIFRRAIWTAYNKQKELPAKAFL